MIDFRQSSRRRRYLCCRFLVYVCIPQFDSSKTSRDVPSLRFPSVSQVRSICVCLGCVLHGLHVFFGAINRATALSMIFLSSDSWNERCRTASSPGGRSIPYWCRLVALIRRNLWVESLPAHQRHDTTRVNDHHWAIHQPTTTIAIHQLTTTTHPQMTCRMHATHHHHCRPSANYHHHP
jgi:hypothetical protein